MEILFQVNIFDERRCCSRSCNLVSLVPWCTSQTSNFLFYFLNKVWKYWIHELAERLWVLSFCRWYVLPGFVFPSSVYVDLFSVFSGEFYVSSDIFCIFLSLIYVLIDFFSILSDELRVQALYTYKKTHSMVMFLYSWFEIKDEMWLRMLFSVVMLLSNWFEISVLFSVLSDEFYVWKWCVYLYLFAMFDSSTKETVYWNHNNFPIKFEKDQYTLSFVYLMNLWSGQPILWRFNKFGIQKTKYTKSKFLMKEILLPLVEGAEIIQWKADRHRQAHAPVVTSPYQFLSHIDHSYSSTVLFINNQLTVSINFLFRE